MITTFENHGLKVVEKIIQTSFATFLQNYCLIYERVHNPIGDQWVPHAAAVYGDPIMENLFSSLGCTVERFTRRQLLPTYAYFRVYHHGDLLPKHTDRNACEISLSVNLGSGNAAPWPLFIESKTGVVPVLLQPGDGVIYKGCDCAHWREPLDGESTCQVFFHFVDANGSNAHWVFDKRSNLNLEVPNSHKQILMLLKNHARHCY